MKKRIKFDEMIIEYDLRRRKGHKKITLSVFKDGRVVVTVPKWISFKLVEIFIKRKKGWILNSVKKIPKNNLIGSSDRRKEYLKYKEKAREFVKKRLKELNKNYEFSYNRISIRKNRSRWGSCSSVGNLNFDYRIIFLESSLQDYLLVHELCHLKEMNHSKEFWNLVEKEVPNYKELRKELRKKKL